MTNEYHFVLDESRLDQMIEALKLAKFAGFRSSSSPVNVLLNAAIDICIRISNSYKDGVPKFERTNPTIKIDRVKLDPLGNPLSVNINRYREEAWSPEIALFTKQLAVFFSRMCRKDFNFQKDFHDLLNSLNDLIPPGIIPQKSKNAEKRKKNIKEIRAKQAQNFYFRRRRHKE